MKISSKRGRLLGIGQDADQSHAVNNVRRRNEPSRALPRFERGYVKYVPGESRFVAANCRFALQGQVRYYSDQRKALVGSIGRRNAREKLLRRTVSKGDPIGTVRQLLR